MLTLGLPAEIQETLLAALRRAGDREVGGVLMAAHVGPNRFDVVEITVHRRGAVASFVRRIEDAIGRLRSFFSRTRNEYTKFNYIGEWHSHPLFAPEPSRKDDNSMSEIVDDPAVGANFAVLLIVKLGPSGNLLASLHTYLPGGAKEPAAICLQTSAVA